MKVVIPLARVSISGGTRIALQYAEELASLGHDVTLLMPYDTNLAYFSPPVNVASKLVKTPGLLRYIMKGIADLIYMALTMPDCDVILCNSWQMVIPAVLSRQARQGTILVHLVQHLDSIIISEKPWFVRWRNSLISSLVYHLPTYKVVVANWLKKAVWEKTKQTAQCIPNVVDVMSFTGGLPPHWQPNKGFIDILVTGRSAKWKGYNDAVEAVRILAKGNPQIRFIVASREPVSLPSDFPSLLVHPQNDLELGRLYQSCSVFVMPSWCEGFGLPALEAMALGTPVVTTACCGIDDFAVDGRNCLIVPPHSPEKLAQAITRILSERELALSLSTEGIKTGQYFTTKRMAIEFIRYMEHIKSSNI